MSEVKREYRIRICKFDGSTPIDKPIYFDTFAYNSNEARLKFFKSYPEGDYDIVSIGLKSEMLKWL